jgi:pimeloyl-ACP methyl ester carboxylesterase
MQDLLLVPGLNCTEALFAPQIAALSRFATCRVVDHRQDFSIEEIADRVLATAPDRFALAGLSMGGHICHEIMRRAAHRVTRLALIDTRASPDSPDDADRRRALVRLAEEGRFGEVHIALWPRLVHPARVSDAVLEAIVRGMADATGPAAFIRQQRALLARRDYRPVLQVYNLPTVIIVGSDDAITPPAMAEELADAIAGSDLYEIPDCGHLSTLEAPKAVNDILRAWLAE